MRKKVPGDLVLTANHKIVKVNNEAGAKGINKQQGTTRIIYDFIEITSGAPTTYNFFENVNSRQFPFTNLTENKLAVGESIALQRFSVLVMRIRTATDEVIDVRALDDIFLGLQPLYKSELNFQIAQDTVIKRLPLTSMFAPFNKTAQFSGQLNYTLFGTTLGYSRPHDVYKFDNPVVIPPQIEFIAPLRSPKYQFVAEPGVRYFLGLVIEGLGSLYAPKNTY